MISSSVTVPSDKVLSPAQQTILESGLLTIGFNCVLQMPTGSGKTWLAEQAIENVLNRNQRAIYLTPLRALASELTSRWQQRFAPKAVGVFTGDYTAQAYPVPYQQAQLLVMTPEKLDACIRSWRSHWHWLPEVDLVVVDELHLLGDPHRGSRLEGALLRLMRLNPFARILGLSATLGNRQELADWLNGVEYVSSWRPIPLSWQVVRYKRAQDKPVLLSQAVHHNLEKGGQTLVFVQSRRRAESLAKFLKESGLCAAHHHAGLDHADRKQIEHAFRSGELSVLVATATLEMGLNLPVRQVVLYDLQGFDGVDFVPLPVNNIWQRAGRAGRPGLDSSGEVVLIAPKWDRWAEQYPKGRFEAIRSGLSRASALAEQVIAEVASGLCRTQVQLETVFAQSLAAKQHALVSVPRTIEDMLQADMLRELDFEGQTRLRATRLGYIAVRHMLSPQTVLLFKRVLEKYSELSFLDLLMLAASSEDCQTLIPVDFEVLEELSQSLSQEASNLLNLPREKLMSLLGADGKRLLAILHTALIARTWTRLGDTSIVADKQGCYAFEVECLRESMERLLTAMVEIAIIPILNPKSPDLDWVTPSEKVRILAHMVSTGLDEQAVTLTLISGIGAKMARQLQQAGIADVEDLALADPLALTKLPGIGQKRAAQWVKAAEEMVDCHSSAYRYRESLSVGHLQTTHWPAEIEPYRLRRALELKVQGQDGGVYRITGGLDPHRVRMGDGQFSCDCPDFGKGHLCKHILAVRLFRGDAELRNLVAALAQNEPTLGLDLFQLWMGV
ncbi:MAG: DEAD/DEAH box helicase [Cyanobacteria bacterium P01_A01_bin.17]